MFKKKYKVMSNLGNKDKLPWELGNARYATRLGAARREKSAREFFNTRAVAYRYPNLTAWVERIKDQ